MSCFQLQRVSLFGHRKALQVRLPTHEKGYKGLGANPRLAGRQTRGLHQMASIYGFGSEEASGILRYGPLRPAQQQGRAWELAIHSHKFLQVL